MIVEVRRSDEGDAVIASIEGEIDMSNTPELRDQLLSAAFDSIGVVVDLRAVRYVDSAAVGMLFDVAAKLDAGRQGMSLVLDGDSPVRRLVEITRLHDVAAPFPSVADAVAHLRADAEDRI